MAINIGADKISDIYIGSDTISEIYIGSDLVYQKGIKFYENGTMYVPFTVGVNYNKRGSVSNTSGYLQVTTTEDTSYMTTNAVDLTNINKLVFEVIYYQYSASPHFFALLVGNNRTARVYNGTFAKKVEGSRVGTYEVDVSNLTGNYYFGFGCVNGTVRVTSIIGR